MQIGVMECKAKVACTGWPTKVRTGEIRWIEEGLELVYGCQVITVTGTDNGKDRFTLRQYEHLQ